MDYDSDDAVSLKSDGTNYLLWSYMMRNFEIEGELWDYVSGSATRPDPKDKNYINLIKHWESMNSTALYIINFYVDSSLKKRLDHIKSAKDAWDYLAGLYAHGDESNFAKKCRLEREIEGVKQSGFPIAGLSRLMQCYWRQLDEMEPKELSNLESYKKYREESRLVQLLMALPDKFEDIRKSMIERSPLPTVSEAVQELLTVEHRLTYDQFSSLSLDDKDCPAKKTNNDQTKRSRGRKKNSPQSTCSSSRLASSLTPGNNQPALSTDQCDLHKSILFGQLESELFGQSPLESGKYQPPFRREEKTEDEVASKPHGMVIDVKEVKMTNSSGQKKFEIEEIGNKASSQLRKPEGIQVEEMQLQASSTLKPQGVVFDGEATKILKSSEMEPEASEQHGLFLMQGGLGLTKPPKDEDWKNAKEIYLMDNELSDLPENPRCPNLSALFLPRNYKLRIIPQPFFNFMPALQILNLSRTGIKSLPDSLIRLVSLKRLFLNDCHRLMILSPKVGDLKQLKVLDLEGANIMDLPKEIKNLTNLTCLEVSFYGFTSNGRRTMQSNAVVPCGVISALSQLEELNIDVNPDDERWDACVEDIVNEVCTLKRLETLKFYFPRVELLSHFQWNSPSLTNFRFTVGHHVKRIISRVPPDAEFELERWERCLKYINGVGVHRDIKNVLQHVTAFFLDRHATIKKLSDFETRNMKQLKCCVVGECNELQVIIDAADAYGEDGISEIVSESYDAERIVLGSLEHLYIYYMKSLRSIWEGSVQQNSLFLLKSLTLRTCPMLTTIFTQGLLDNLCNLEELKVEDCPSIKSIVSCGNFAELRTSHFLPNLKKILLHYMPGLVSISSGLHIAPQLEFLSLYNCPNLKNPLVDEVSCQDLKKIKGERSWWEALEWSNGRPCYLDEIFVPTDI